jgi:hypothetical protein
LLQGAELLRFWESSHGVRRVFASCCGSPLYKESDGEREILRLRLGSLDSDPGIQIEQHYTLGSMAPWVVLDDVIAREYNGPPFGSRG